MPIYLYILQEYTIPMHRGTDVQGRPPECVVRQEAFRKSAGMRRQAEEVL